ncbi:Superfamily II DNA or RNA helicase, SNF2 family [Terribacillus halophilus]|uniref:Superfamily II DNA or RNA helicase, SNF2 family n=1 Tax=Terribacillus halophilus TaxID=361279 RepID=A0A1G6L4X1_9BACI|nr:DEAD/DEAH box helicase [Terribacillus halophilus]SDC38181.1 Superfamily II DNA or RNA helicase, SNF2 family [Terribacillus halophilus]
MNGEWYIKDNHFLVMKDEDNNTIIPTAEEVFLSEFKNYNVKNIKLPKPSDNLPSINFSKYPINLKILIEPNTNDEDVYMNANVVVEIDGEYIYIGNILRSHVEHMIIKDTWYPFIRGTVSEIWQYLKEAGIEKLGPISLKQYMILKKMENSLLIDKLSEASLNKEEYISKSDIDIQRFIGNLYPYQNQGFRWLKMIIGENAGCILADEMGLGKTAQIIAVLASESVQAKTPSLVVAPVSLLENWRREILKFAPSLTVKLHQGNDRTGFHAEFKKYDLIITSYETIVRDLSLFQMLQWNIVVADEAQNIKNPFAKRTKALKQIKRASTIAVTGTPIENKLMDLWSITDFVFPSYLGNLNEFEKVFPDSLDGAEELEPIVSPIILRRKVKEVADDLPERLDIPQGLKLSDKEALVYDSLRKQLIDEYGKHASLVSLIKLRMFCTHPFLVCSTDNEDPAVFGKYMRLVEILEEIISNNEKVIIFTSYTGMSNILVKDLTSRFNIFCDFIDGRVEVGERQPKIDKFSSTNGPAILVLNPRAAGAGLNITAANHVVHYNLEWNPAIEDQASARAHRRGQTRPVTIYKLFYLDTVEDAINERLERKRQLSQAAVIGIDGSENDQADILEALHRSPLI